MFDFLINRLSSELMSQAEYINGVLYLPAYELFSELLTCVGALVIAALFMLATGIISESVFCFGCWLRRIIKSRKEIKCSDGI